MAGEIDKAMKFLRFYSQTRLLGNYVPYAKHGLKEISATFRQKVPCTEE